MMSLILVACVVFVLHACVEHALNHGFEEGTDGDKPKFLSAVDSDGWTRAAVIAAIVGAANYFAPRCNSLAIAILCWIAVLAVIVYEVQYFARYGDQFREALCFLLTLIPVTLTFKAAAAAVQETANGIWGLWGPLNNAIVIAAFATIVIMLLQRRYTETENGACKAGAIIALILAIAMILGAFAGGHFFKKGSGNTAEDDDTPTIASTWYKFYCYDVGDFQFGPPANPDGTAEGAKAEHYARIEKDPALGAATFANFDVRLGTDFLEPGYHYDQHQSDGQWTTRINERIRYYLANQEEYAKAVKRWKTFVDRYASVKLSHKTGLRDQMYAVSYGNIDEPPQIIVAETDQPDGDILEYVFLIKGNEFVVPFRTDCGDQPTDVGEIMKETPQANPVKTKASSSSTSSTSTTSTSTSTSTTPASKTSGGDSQTSKVSGGDSTSTVIPPVRIGGRTITGGKSGGSGGSGGRGGSGGGGGSSSSTKDPTKGTAVGGNDTSGPGPDTNNGVGSQYSSADEPTNSAFIKPITGGGESKSAYDVYEDRIEDLNKTNATQKVGGDANTPSYKVGSGSKSSGGSSSSSSSSSTSSGSSSSSGGTEDRVTIHSNADKGNGYGGIDQQPSTEKTSSSGVEKALKSDDASKNTEISMPD